ncbi:MAG: hypothetical protein K2W81_06270 [Sphingomonas sp.]|uniref:hypothetical protein n=1 Tax=Sphingomonas sp. TaxID=28214 RepID=UPI0025DFA47E|nr:hypothetical protein [Sphingomonas sp.]MBY0283552.1 hypothetical protein [Sphingomonas sp.]
MAALPYLRIFLSAFLVTVALVPATLQQAVRKPPEHGPPAPFFNAMTPEEVTRYSDGGTEVEHHRNPADELAEHRRIDRALASLAPQRKGVVDDHVVTVAPDSDGEFSRDARESLSSHRSGTSLAGAGSVTYAIDWTTAGRKLWDEPLIRACGVLATVAKREKAETCVPHLEAAAAPAPAAPPGP